MSVRSPNRIAVLDGFRALAILAVLAFHYTVRWVAPTDVPPHLPISSPFVGFVPFQYGWMGVELFFVISGFVILMTLKRCDSISDFAVRRFARLWPALIVGAALTAVVANLLGPSDWKVGFADYVASLILVDPRLLDLAGFHVQWVDGVYWTLWVELRFYVIAAILYFLSGRRFLRVWIPFQVVVAAATFGVPASILEISVFPDYLPYFTIGICVFELWSGTAERKLAIAGWVIAAGFILYQSVTGQGAFVGRAALVCAIANAAIFGLFILFLMDSPVLDLFSSKPMVRVGRASHSLYLIHQKMGVTLLRALDGLPFLISPLLVFGTCLAAAMAMFRFVELPAQRLLMAHLHHRLAPVAKSAPINTRS